MKKNDNTVINANGTASGAVVAKKKRYFRANTAELWPLYSDDNSIDSVFCVKH